MAWVTKTFTRDNESYTISTETLTFTTSDNTSSKDLTSSAMNFLVPGKDYTIICNTGATSLSSDADLAIKVTYISSGTYAVLKDDADASITNAVNAYFADISSIGEAPYTKLFIDSDGVQKKTDTIGLAVIQYV